MLHLFLFFNNCTFHSVYTFYTQSGFHLLSGQRKIINHWKRTRTKVQTTFLYFKISLQYYCYFFYPFLTTKSIWFSGIISFGNTWWLKSLFIAAVQFLSISQNHLVYKGPLEITHSNHPSLPAGSARLGFPGLCSVRLVEV